MPRQIKLKPANALLTEGDETKYDNYYSQMLKLVPADITAVYLCLQSLILQGVSNENARLYFSCGICILLLIVLPFYLKIKGKVTVNRQIIITEIALIIWMIAIGSPLDSIKFDGFTAKFIGSLLLVLFTFIAPLIYTNEDKPPIT
jgi:hypothetical protein